MASTQFVVAVAVLLLAPAAFAQLGSQAAKNGTCSVLNAGGEIMDKSNRTCLDCHLQCFSDGCTTMNFEAVSVTGPRQLATYMCPDAKVQGASGVPHIHLCVELTATGAIAEGVLRTCRACMRRCKSRGEVGCAEVVYGGVTIKRADLDAYYNSTCPPEPSPSPAIIPSPSPYVPFSPIIPSPRPPSPSPAPLNCTDVLDIGTGSTTVDRYFYNATTNTCATFTYTGVGGNTNNFENLDACVRGCVKPPSPMPPKAAPAAETPMRRLAL